jgi:hypothetical protein
MGQLWSGGEGRFFCEVAVGAGLAVVWDDAMGEAVEVEEQQCFRIGWVAARRDEVFGITHAGAEPHFIDPAGQAAGGGTLFVRVGPEIEWQFIATADASRGPAFHELAIDEEGYRLAVEYAGQMGPLVESEWLLGGGRGVVVA